MEKDKSIEVTPEMIKAGLNEYMRPYRDEDAPQDIVTEIYLAMRRAQPSSLPEEATARGA